MTTDNAPEPQPTHVDGRPDGPVGGLASQGLGRGRSNVVTLGQLSFLSGAAQEMVYPLIPTFVVITLGASRTLLGLIEGLLMVGVTVARLGSAWVLDHGRSPRRVLRIAYTASLVSRPLLALAAGVGAVVVLRTVDGLGKGGKDAPKDLLVSVDSTEARAGRAFGVLRALDTAGSVAGPLLAGALLLVLGHGSKGLRAVFALSAIPAVAGLWMLRRVHDAPAPPPRHESEQRPLPRPFRVLLVAVLVFGLANSSDTLLLLRAGAAGLSASQLAFAYALVNLVYAGMAVPLGSLSDRVGRRPLLIVAWTVYAVAYLGFAFATNAVQIWGLFALYGIYYASAEGTVKAWVASLVPVERRGAAYGLLAAAAGLLVLPASVLAGALWDHVSLAAAFSVGAGFALVALAILVLSPSLRRVAAGP
jgi:MFS family permease